MRVRVPPSAPENSFCIYAPIGGAFFIDFISDFLQRRHKFAIIKQRWLKMKKILMLIDGSSLIHRAFYALPLLQNKDGIYTNGVYGFLTMLNRLLDTYNPDYIAVAFDRSSPTFRHQDYEAYKANRQKTPSELSSQFGILKDILKSMQISTLDLDGYEADDICGTLATKGVEEKMEVLLVTGDRDYFQLVNESTTVLLTRKGITEMEAFTLEKIREDYKIQPRDFIQVKGLMGDSSDNIPGVPGIGEKKALEYIRQYGTLENLYNHIDEIRGPKTRQTIEENKAMAFLSRKLGEIFLEAPIETDLNHYKILPVKQEELNEKLARLDMNSLIKETKTETETGKKEVEYKVLSLQQLISSAMEKKSFSYLFAYDGDYIKEDPVILALQTEDGVLLTDMADFESLVPLFTDKEILKISFNVKESLLPFIRRNMEIENVEDVLILAYLINPSEAMEDLEKTGKKYQFSMMKEEDILGKGKGKKHWKELDSQAKERFFGGRLTCLKPLFIQLFELVKERQMLHLYKDVELPLIGVLADMEKEGFFVDKNILEELGKEFNSRIQNLADCIFKLAGEEFNLNSPKQLGTVLFEKLQLPPIKKTKTGYSTDVDVLEKLKKKHPMIEKILEYRTLSKLKSTYIDGLLLLLDDGNKIHSHFKQTITATGRISSTEPNLQNIPTKTEEGRRIRKAFIAPEGMSLLDGDYSQIELRVLAHLAQDETMLNAFLEGADIHTKTAAEVFHVAIEDVTSLMRSRAKAVNFGIVYGISDFGLSRDLDISRKEAKEYIEGYLSTYPAIKNYMDEIVKLGKKQGFVETILNRRRYIPELQSKNFNIRNFGERIALNTPIQGSAADIIKIAMVRVYKALKKEKLKAKLILQVHDELILQVPENEKERVREILFSEMEQAVALKVKLKVDGSWGKSWYEAK